MLYKLLFTLLIAFSVGNVQAQDCPETCEAQFPEKLKGEKECHECKRYFVKSNCTFQSYHLTVFNRWGVQVYETHDRDVELNFHDFDEEGTYVWIVNLTFCNGDELSESGKLYIYK